MTKYVYGFGDDIGTRAPKELLGGKGAGLFEMTRLGIPVPPGFTISTEASTHFSKTGEPPPGLAEEVDAALARLEQAIGKKFGDPTNPLLVSVRSGARASMPGMMDTILNLGLNDDTLEGLANASGNRRFALDAYRRLIEMYGDVVQQVPREHYDAALTAKKRAVGDGSMADHELDVRALEEVIAEFKRITEHEAKVPFVADVRAQLWGAIGAVFRSWNNARARRYRRMQDIPDDWGTAVNVQVMVFGNMGFDSGSGVCFTRNPSNGEKVLYGEFLPNAQGEDVVAGIRTPEPITARAAVPGREDRSLERSMPKAFAEVLAFAERLEKQFRDVQDIEFTIEKDRVYVLQTRNAKRAPQAAVKIAVDLVQEGLLDEKRALLTVDPEALEQLLHDRLPSPDELAKRGVHAIAAGLPASPGAAIGAIVLDADAAEEAAKEGTAVILVRRETSPEDIHGMKAAAGILTATGGMTSHAAVVARGLGKCCVAGVASLTVDYESRTVAVRTERGELLTMKPGDKLTLDGTTGRVYQGELEVEPAATVPELDALLGWADRFRRLDVRANADTPRGAKQAFAYGARGIGLCRTEHMFFADERLEAVRCMVLSDEGDRERWVKTIEPMQREDFVEIFRAMGGLPVTIRLLDWPLHEFLPRETKELESVAHALKLPVGEVRTRALALHEVNPMLGHRGVRVGITAPTIYRMQVRAILAAALEVAKSGTAVFPEIMIPVVGLASELRAAVDLVRAEAETVLAGETLPYQVGTMIELPRACLVADDLAEVAEFFSFGTNDLTQTTFGISRDDAGRFLPQYLGDPRGLLPSDPFVRLDERGVGELMRIAVERGRKTRGDLKLGICGEHGGNPASIGFAEKLKLSYVSCSPPRLPVARLAAAQAAIREER